MLLRKKLVVVLGTAVMLISMLAFSGPVFAAANPSPTGTGLPSQSCEALGTTGPAGFTSGGFQRAKDTYNETSQYDVACYQLLQAGKLERVAPF